MKTIARAGKFMIRSGINVFTQISRRDRRIIAEYFEGPHPKKLQIGCGSHPVSGWLNSSFPVSVRPFSRQRKIVRLDATRPFPLPDGSFDYVWSEHMIEHVPYLGGCSMLLECFRVLRPGGRIRLSTPDLQFLLDLLHGPLDTRQRSYVEWAGRNFLPQGVPVTPVSIFNNFVRSWGHEFIYDRKTITDLLGRSGFVDIVPCPVNQSKEPEFLGVDFSDRLPDGFIELETMTYEARKPG